MDVPVTDADLGWLLTQLLRAVRPAAVADNGALLLIAQEDTPREGDGLRSGEGDPAEQGVPAGGGARAQGAPAASVSEARALVELLAARGIAQGQLATLLGLEKSTVSRLAASLERKGWIRRGRDRGNQRYIRLYLTPEGREVAGRLWRAWQSRQARLLASLTPGERAGLAAGLSGLIRGLAAEGLLTPSAAVGDPAAGRAVGDPAAAAGDRAAGDRAAGDPPAAADRLASAPQSPPTAPPTGPHGAR